jgi:3'-5' exonuclease
MFEQIHLENILFLDIETVPKYSQYSDLPDLEKELWDKKSNYFRTADQSGSDVYNRAGIYAEFGKIICISVGFIHIEGGQRKIRIKSFSNDEEKKLILEFMSMLKAFGERKDFSLCAHNGKEFDFPYIARRMLINGLVIPEVLDVAGKKPWEVKFIDTLDLWKFGDYKHYSSLNLLAYIFGIPSPKDDIDGSMVSDIYYEKKDLPRIVKYCEKDVITVIQLILKFKALDLIPEENFIFVP